MDLIKKAKEQIVKPRVFIPIAITFIIVFVVTYVKYYKD